MFTAKCPVCGASTEGCSSIYGTSIAAGWQTVQVYEEAVLDYRGFKETPFDHYHQYYWCCSEEHAAITEARCNLLNTLAMKSDTLEPYCVTYQEEGWGLRHDVCRSRMRAEFFARTLLESPWARSYVIAPSVARCPGGVYGMHEVKLKGPK